VIHAPKSSAEARKRRWQFPRWIEQECRDPGIRNALRTAGRTATATAADRADRCIAPWLPGGNQDTEAAYYTLARIIADRPRYSFTDDSEDESDSADGETTGAEESPTDPGEGTDEARDDVTSSGSAPVLRTRHREGGESLGAALARAVLTRGMRVSTAADMLKNMAGQTVDGAHQRLPRVIRHLRAHLDETERPLLHWPRLHGELIAWRAERHQICRRWRQDFYQQLNDNAQNEADLADAEALGQN
jgi:CRISPR system Cascade subunit CasB